jgi:hypothetical protein
LDIVAELSEDELNRALLDQNLPIGGSETERRNRLLDFYVPGAEPLAATPRLATAISRPADADWAEREDPKTGRTYYINKLQRTSTWTRPGHLAPPPTLAPTMSIRLEDMLDVIEELSATELQTALREQARPHCWIIGCSHQSTPRRGFARRSDPGWNARRGWSWASTRRRSGSGCACTTAPEATTARPGARATGSRRATLRPAACCTWRRLCHRPRRAASCGCRATRRTSPRSPTSIRRATRTTFNAAGGLTRWATTRPPRMNSSTRATPSPAGALRRPARPTRRSSTARCHPRRRARSPTVPTPPALQTSRRQPTVRDELLYQFELCGILQV